MRFDLYSANIDQQLFVVLVFDRRQRLNRIGMVWLYAKRAMIDLQNTLARSDDAGPLSASQGLLR